MTSPLRLIEALLVFLSVCGCSYYVLCLWSAIRFLRRSNPGNAVFTPPISLLKPLKGMDPEIYSSLRSHCLQNYPEYEIIFGVSEENDPAVASVRELQREFPKQKLQLVVCPQVLGGNIKVSNLVQMLPQARHDYLLVNDSDIRVAPDYLRRVVAPLANKKTGMVTCLYRGVAAKTLGSRLEALGISTDFCGGVLSAIELEGGPHFGLGSTLVFRRSDLAAIGGFENLLDYLADDYQLGQKLSQHGLDGYLSDVVVDTFLPPYSWRGFFDHQLRWARSVRDSRGWGYLGVALTFGLPWAMFLAIVGRGKLWTLGFVGFVLALRMLLAFVVGVKVAGDPQVPKYFWLIPLRDLAALIIWAAGYLGSTVIWRGERFWLKDGKLTRVAT